MNVKTIIIILLAVIITILTIQNIHPVEVSVLFWKDSYPLIVIIFIMLGLGFIAGYFLGSAAKISKKDSAPRDIKTEKK